MTTNAITVAGELLTVLGRAAKSLDGAEVLIAVGLAFAMTAQQTHINRGEAHKGLDVAWELANKLKQLYPELDMRQ